MKKIFKSAVAVILCMLMLAGIMPLSVFADEAGNNSTNIDSEETFGKENAFGLIANNLAGDGGNEEYKVSYAWVDGKTVIVDFCNAAPCKLVVAIYDENTMQMLASGMKDVAVDHLSESVTLDISVPMPEHFVMKAFLLDDNYAALSNQYTSYEYTTKYDEFLEKKPEDFSGNEVLVFDEEKENEDFAVLVDDAISSDYDSSMTFSYDEATLTFTFNNALDDIKNLKVGDVYYYQYGDATNDFLLFKVADINVKGNTVKIVEDENIELSDIFEFIRLDEQADYSQIEDEDIQYGIGMTPTDEDFDETLSTQDDDPTWHYEDKNKSWNTTLSIKWNLWSNSTITDDSKKPDNASLSASVSASAGFKFNSSVKLIYDVKLFGKDYYEFKSETTYTLYFADISVSGTFKLPEKFDPLTYLSMLIPAIPIGPFSLSIKPALVAEFSASINIELIKYESKQTITADRENGFIKTTTTKPELKTPNIDGKISLKLGVKLTFTLSFTGLDKTKWKDRVGISLSGEFGAKYSGSVDTAIPDRNIHHDCRICISGPVSCYLNVKLTFKLVIIKKVIDFSFDAVDWTPVDKELFKFHISWGKDGKLSCGKGECNNKSHLVTFVVWYSENNLPVYIDCATVSSATGFCDNDKDEQWDDHTTLTDSSGKAEFYFKPGEHSVTASCSGYGNLTQNFSIIENSKTVTIRLSKDSDTPDTPTDPTNPGTSDGTGSNDGWADSTHIRFGSYPQSKVTDSSLISALNGAGGSWKSYGYYSGTGDWDDGRMKPSDYMRYKDVSYNGSKYRAVTFDSYRPYCTGYTSSSNKQQGNGYYTGNVYWFKYEPIKWRVLDPSTGLVMCDTAIDSQAYNNYIWYGVGSLSSSSKYYGDEAHTYYASNYANSSIRAWLNKDFYNTAFSSDQKSNIVSTTLDNSSTYSSAYDAPSTTDKIFLLSCNDSINSNYGFSSSASAYDTARQLKSTDYAKCQGCYQDTSDSYRGNCWWWLRSSHSSYDARGVGSGGNGGYAPNVYETYRGVVPALKLNLSSLSTQSEVSTQAAKEGMVFNYSCSACEAGGEYILLNVTGYGSDFELTTSNLEYIDQLTADSNGTVEGTFMPRNAYTNSTTLLIGKFGNTVQAKKLDVTEGTAEEIAEKFEIKGYVENLSVDYKATLTFTATVEAPAGYKIVWSNGVEGKECTLTKVTNSEYQISAKLIKISDGTTLKETKVETVTVKTNFFAKLIAFFKGLFGSLPKYVDNKRV